MYLKLRAWAHRRHPRKSRKWKAHKYWRTIAENKAKCSRYSVAFFYNPNFDTEIACLETCQKDKPAIYSPITAKEYLLNRLRATF